MQGDLQYATAVTERHAVYVSAWQFNGEWWAKIMVDGVCLSYESLGPIVTVPGFVE